MLRRSFLQLMAAAITAPMVSRLEVLPHALGSFGAEPVLAVETTTPYWLLEMQAYQRLYNAAWSARMDYMLPPTPKGHRWRATFPTHPTVAR